MLQNSLSPDFVRSTTEEQQVNLFKVVPKTNLDCQSKVRKIRVWLQVSLKQEAAVYLVQKLGVQPAALCGCSWAFSASPSIFKRDPLATKPATECDCRCFLLLLHDKSKVESFWCKELKLMIHCNYFLTSSIIFCPSCVYSGGSLRSCY